MSIFGYKLIKLSSVGLVLTKRGEIYNFAKKAEDSYPPPCIKKYSNKGTCPLAACTVCATPLLSLP